MIELSLMTFGVLLSFAVYGVLDLVLRGVEEIQKRRTS